MITIRVIYFFVILAAFLLTLLTIGVYYYLRQRQRRLYPYGKWETLLRRLSAVNKEQIAMVARDLVDETGQKRTDEDELDLDPTQVWELVGGMKGLLILERNCAVLVDLVFYVQQWYPEALAITEQMRQNAREIEWHISRLKGAEKNGRLDEAFADYAQRAVATYYVMTRRVLTVYQQLDLPGLAELQRALYQKA
jgi:hypothetical protein